MSNAMELYDDAYGDMESTENYVGVGVESTVYGSHNEMPVGVGIGIGVLFLIYFLFFAIMFISLWKIFVKAGQAGWAAIVPIYNAIIILQIANKPLWWILLLFIPLVNIVIVVMTWHEIVKCFGKGLGFLIGLIFFPYIFAPILAFGDAQYNELVEEHANDSMSS